MTLWIGNPHERNRETNIQFNILERENISITTACIILSLISLMKVVNPQIILSLFSYYRYTFFNENKVHEYILSELEGKKERGM